MHPFMCQRTNGTAALVKITHVINIRHVDRVYAATPAPIPRKERIRRPYRQPPERSEPHPDTYAPASKSEEGHVCRRPCRTVAAAHGSGPPIPRRSARKPASIVIRRPPPRLV